jgi:glycerol kinase
MQFLADIINAPVDRPKTQETTALGVAWLAGMRAGLYPDQASFAKSWACDTKFMPQMADTLRDMKYAAWQKAVQATLSV